MPVLAGVANRPGHARIGRGEYLALDAAKTLAPSAEQTMELQYPDTGRGVHHRLGLGGEK